MILLTSKVSLIVILFAVILLEVSISPLIFIILLLSNLPIILQRSSPGIPWILEAYNILLAVK